MADEKDKGAVQHADSNSNRKDKGAVEATVVAAAGLPGRSYPRGVRRGVMRGVR